jgi:hypothetical protein
MNLQPAPLKTPIDGESYASQPWLAWFSDIYRVLKSQINADSNYQPLRPDIYTYLSTHWRFREEPITLNLLLEYSATGNDPWTEKNRFF